MYPANVELCTFYLFVLINFLLFSVRSYAVWVYVDDVDSNNWGNWTCVGRDNLGLFTCLEIFFFYQWYLLWVHLTSMFMFPCFRCHGWLLFVGGFARICWFCWKVSQNAFLLHLWYRWIRWNYQYTTHACPIQQYEVKHAKNIIIFYVKLLLVWIASLGNKACLR